jgi:hypothetical protein
MKNSRNDYMRRLMLTLLLVPICVFSKQVVITITPDYPLTPTNSQLICASLHANLPMDVLLKLDSLKSLAYTCKMTESTNQLVISMTLKDTPSS